MISSSSLEVEDNVSRVRMTLENQGVNKNLSTNRMLINIIFFLYIQFLEQIHRKNQNNIIRPCCRMIEQCSIQYSFSNVRRSQMHLSYSFFSQSFVFTSFTHDDVSCESYRMINDRSFNKHLFAFLRCQSLVENRLVICHRNICYVICSPFAIQYYHFKTKPCDKNFVFKYTYLSSLCTS